MISKFLNAFFLKNVGIVYLIRENNESNNYKIGSTKHNDISKRIRGLQTGNPNELLLVKSFNTNEQFKLEHMLHRHYKFKRGNGEWFVFDEDDVKCFEDVCKKYQRVIDSLSDNPFW